MHIILLLLLTCSRTFTPCNRELLSIKTHMGRHSRNRNLRNRHTDRGHRFTMVFRPIISRDNMDNRTPTLFRRAMLFRTIRRCRQVRRFPVVFRHCPSRPDRTCNLTVRQRNPLIIFTILRQPIGGCISKKGNRSKEMTPISPPKKDVITISSTQQRFYAVR